MFFKNPALFFCLFTSFPQDTNQHKLIKPCARDSNQAQLQFCLENSFVFSTFPHFALAIKMFQFNFESILVCNQCNQIGQNFSTLANFLESVAIFCEFISVAFGIYFCNYIMLLDQNILIIVKRQILKRQAGHSVRKLQAVTAFSALTDGLNVLLLSLQKFPIPNLI